MGEFLSQPIKDKHSDDGENQSVRKIIIKVKIRCISYAGLEKKNGRFSYH